MPRYEIVRDLDEVEHVVLPTGEPFEHEAVCDDLDEAYIDGPGPELCDGCLRWLAAHGDAEALARAVAGERAGLARGRAHGCHDVTHRARSSARAVARAARVPKLVAEQRAGLHGEGVARARDVDHDGDARP